MSDGHAPAHCSFKVNQRIRLSLSGLSGTRQYTSLIQDVGEDILFVLLPAEKGEYVPVRKGEQVSAVVFASHGLYRFNTAVVGKLTYRLPLLCLAKPARVERFQQRAHPRTAAFFPVVYRAAASSLAGHRGIPAGETVYSRDISMGGMGLTSKHPLPVGLQLLMLAEMPGRGFVQIRPQARVRRSGRDALTGSYLIGTEFTRLEGRDRQAIESYVVASEGVVDES